MTIWLLARATGFVALIAFTLSIVFGALSSRPKKDPSYVQLDRRFLMQMAHRSTSVVGLALILAHTFLIVIDKFVDVSITGTLIPFAAGFRPLALGAGTLGVYTILIVVVSGAVRGRLPTSVASARRWRFVHQWAYLGWILIVGHGIFAGTDTRARWAIETYVSCAAVVILVIAIRMFAELKFRARPLSSARTRLIDPGRGPR